MPTSVPGSKGPAPALACTRLAARGFTLIELMVVVALIAIAVGVISLALRDGDSDQLEREAARLTALLESARAEARAAGLPVLWVPTAEAEEHGFRFLGLPASLKLPARWMDERVTAQIIGSASVVLGPEAILPPQRILLRLESATLELASDGLAPFAARTATAEAPS